MTAAQGRAWKTLEATFWTSGAWRREPLMPAPEDLAHAVGQRMMFESPLELSHDDLVGAAREAARVTSRARVANAFVVSLRTRRLELRSALGSFALLMHLPEHNFVEGSTIVGADGCGVCGARLVNRLDRNAANFERHKWGGATTWQVAYALFDLTELGHADVPEAGLAERALMADLLVELEQAPNAMTAYEASRKLLKSIKANGAERERLLSILGASSVLETPDRRGYAVAFVNADDRVLPPTHNVFGDYPVCWWRGEHGVNRQAASDLGLTE